MLAFHWGVYDGLTKLAEEEEEGALSDQEKEVVMFLLGNPNPKDEKFHAFAESKGMEPDELEAAAYKLATRFAKFWGDGKAKEKGITSKDVDQGQLRKGIKVEKEHTPEKPVAKRIATDHLAEISDYYSRLDKMESSAKKTED